MSLAIAIDQITRPSWMAERMPDAPEQRWFNGPQKQARVLEIMRKHGKRVNCEFLSRETGYTKQSIRYVTAELIAQEKIKRTAHRNNRVWWVLV